MSKLNWSDNSMINKKYYRLKIIKIGETNKDKKGSRKITCICDCGNLKIINNFNWSRKTKSCGCLDKETKFKHGKIDTPLYRIWYGIKTRCNNKNCKSFKDYGGRGIVYDVSWNDFLNFEKDMRLEYFMCYRKNRRKINKTDYLTIERIDVNGNYCKNNCTFILKSEQNNNKRKKRLK